MPSTKLRAPAVYQALAKSLRALPKQRRSNAREDLWYHSTYKIFARKQTGNLSPSGPDFCKTVAFAYSWVATIPKCDPSRSVRAISQAASALRSHEKLPLAEYSAVEARTLRLELLQKVKGALAMETSTKVVVASKVLHFFDSKLAPMIDRNVGKGWGKINKDLRDFVKLKIISTNSPSESQYLRYWEVAYQLRKREKMSYRKLDTLLFRS